MFYVVSKIMTALTLPSSIAVTAIGVGTLMLFAPRLARLGKKLAIFGLALLLLLGIAPIGNVLIHPLEERFAGGKEPTSSDGITGIIVLGGFEESWVSSGRRLLSINEAAERLTETVRLALRLPETRVVFSGGAGGILQANQDAAGEVGSYLRDVGIAPDRIVLEGRSRNTHENAVFTRDLVTPKSGERWLLITSAYHMPRSVATFRKAGFDVIPWPVDFRTRDAGDMLRAFDTIPDGLKRVDLASREYAGLVAYWLTDRSDALWPGPR